MNIKVINKKEIETQSKLYIDSIAVPDNIPCPSCGDSVRYDIFKTYKLEGEEWTEDPQYVYECINCGDSFYLQDVLDCIG